MKSKSSLARKWDKNSLIPRENKGDVQLFPAAGKSCGIWEFYWVHLQTD